MSDASVMKLVQFGWESTWASEVATTVKLLGVTDITLKPDNEVKLFPDLRGSMAPAYKNALVKKAAAGSIKGVAYHEMINYILENMLGAASPSGTGPYVRAYTAPLTTVPTRKPWTALLGTSGGAIYNAAGLLFTKLTLTQEPWSEAQFSADFVAQVHNTDTIDSLSDTTPTVITSDQWLVYLDAVGGTVGTTAITTTSIGFELTIEAPIKLIPHVGSLTAASYAQDRWSGSLKTDLELNSTAKTQLDAIVTGTSAVEKQLRLKATSGTVISQFDFAGPVDHKPDLVGDKDAYQTVSLNWMPTYNTALSNWLKISTTNGVSSI